MTTISDDAIDAAAAIAVRRMHDRAAPVPRSTPNDTAVAEATQWPAERVAAAVRELYDSHVIVRTAAGRETFWSTQAYLDSVAPDPRYQMARASFKEALTKPV